MADIHAPDTLRPEQRRRSKRIKARIEVVVRSQEKRTFSEKTHTLMVNAHGALLLLAMTVSVDKFVVLENTATSQELLCRVTHVGTHFMGKAQVGVEFIKPAPDFWGISPRPEDWVSNRALGRPTKRMSKEPAISKA
ncbi:MAG: hypothetical protein WB780_15030 [Candidatus Acidiferrales bacterium]